MVIRARLSETVPGSGALSGAGEKSIDYESLPIDEKGRVPV
jgi:hypothetical protein